MNKNKNMFNRQEPYEYLVKVAEFILNLNHNVQQLCWVIRDS